MVRAFSFLINILIQLCRPVSRGCEQWFFARQKKVNKRVDLSQAVTVSYLYSFSFNRFEFPPYRLAKIVCRLVTDYLLYKYSVRFFLFRRVCYMTCPHCPHYVPIPVTGYYIQWPIWPLYGPFPDGFMTSLLGLYPV